jgi:hypothetical protein
MIDYSKYIGTTVGKLTIIDVYEDASIQNNKSKWKALCNCSCGNIKEIPLRYITGNGRLVKSCGCTRKINTQPMLIKECKRLYNVYYGMLNRCYNKTNHAYKDYGGRGIVVYCKWRGDFEIFRKWALSSGYADGLSIDRIDVNGSYYPDNCRWADMKTQSRNKRNTIRVTYEGEEKVLLDLAERFNISADLLYQRVVGRGMPIEEALSAPLGWREQDPKKNSEDHMKKEAHPLTYKGKTQSLYCWCRELGLEYTPTYKRWHRGWSPEKLFETPIEHRRQNDGHRA